MTGSITRQRDAVYILLMLEDDRYYAIIVDIASEDILPPKGKVKKVLPLIACHACLQYHRQGSRYKENQKGKANYKPREEEN